MGYCRDWRNRRRHLLQLTAAGKRRLHRSLPLWEEAQSQFISQINPERLQALRVLLTTAESAVTNVSTTKQEDPQPTESRVRKKSTHASRSN
jgi:hypothetical protein